MMKRITLQACSLKNSIQKVFFLFMVNWTYLNRIGGGVLPLLPLGTCLKNTDCPTRNYGNTIHYNGIAVIFCGTVCILYHNGNRLRLINRGLLFNLRLSTECQKFEGDSARWHYWNEETRRVHVKTLRDYVPTFSDEFVKSKNVGRKPAFLNRKRYREPPTVLSIVWRNSKRKARKIYV